MDDLRARLASGAPPVCVVTLEAGARGPVLVPSVGDVQAAVDSAIAAVSDRGVGWGSRGADQRLVTTLFGRKLKCPSTLPIHTAHPHSQPFPFFPSDHRSRHLRSCLA